MYQMIGYHQEIADKGLSRGNELCQLNLGEWVTQNLGVTDEYQCGVDNSHFC